jgi:hypothetical protein
LLTVNYLLNIGVRLNKRQKCFIGLITNRYCDPGGLINDTIGLSTEIALRYEPLCRPIFNTNSSFMTRKTGPAKTTQPN